MNAKVYLLVDIVDGNCGPVIRSLSSRPGVAVDWLEGHPDIIISLEAADRSRLAEMMISVIDTIGNVTEDLRLLIRRESQLPPLVRRDGDGAGEGQKDGLDFPVRAQGYHREPAAVKGQARPPSYRRSRNNGH
jgi:hypothetical protein